MSTMMCPPAERLKAFYLGKLSDDHSEELVAHVGSCSACQSELETVIDAEDSLIADLRVEDSDVALDREPACEIGVLRALGALAGASELGVSSDFHVDLGELMPRTIGEYEIVRSLGQGGMGHVYLARHNKLGRLVALKILAGHRLGDQRANHRFEAEMRAVGRLSHPNIVTAHDAREIDGTAILVTEFIDGFDLGELLRRTGPLAVADACEIVRQVALALQYISDQGFVHRDVKPSNIMLSVRGEVKLLDLGLARFQISDPESPEFTGTGQTMGTADYISPEQVTDSRNVDVRSDIYSLGATLFKLLVGRAPFADEKHSTAFSKMTAHVSEAPLGLKSLRSEVPDELARLVATMLAKSPDDRPQRPDSIVMKLTALAEANNLETLAMKTAVVHASHPTLNGVTPNAIPKTQTQSWWHRPVKLYVAIAAGLVGMLLGLCFGIIITITNPDGSKTVMMLPEGTKVEVSEGASAQSQVSDKASKPKTGTLLENAAPTFNGHTLDEWLELLRTEKSRQGQINAIAGLKGLRTEQNSNRILEATITSIEKQKSPATEEFEFLRSILGPKAFGEWLVDQLDKNQIDLTEAILRNHTDNTWTATTLRPEHHLIAEWLSDPTHQLGIENESSDIRETTIQFCVKSFLANMFYSPELKDDALETCFQAARNQPALGDTFLLEVPGMRGPNAASKFPEDERIQRFSQLAIEKLLAENSDPLQASRAMAILISYPHQIPDDKVASLVSATKKRFGDLLKKRDRIDCSATTRSSL